MRLQISIITLLATLGVLLSRPADSTIYTWQDQNGTASFTDDSSGVPRNAEVKVWSNDSAPQTTSSTPSSETNTDTIDQPTPEQTEAMAPSPATQGEFAVQLVTELGLGKSLGPEEAADLLTRIRVAPPLGRWEINEPMTPELTVRLRTLTVSATRMGWLTLTPEQALLSFDTTAALLGVLIPAAPAPDTAGLPYANAANAANAEIPPPLVYVTPPPPIFVSYYTWVPVVDGFWWGDTWFGGFFVLTSFHSHEFRHRRFFIDHEFIEHRFHDHIIDHRFGRVPGSASLHGRGPFVAPNPPNRTSGPTPRLHAPSGSSQPPSPGRRSGRAPLSQPGERAFIHPPSPPAIASRARIAPPISSSRPLRRPMGAPPSTPAPGTNRPSPPSGGFPHEQPQHNAGRVTGHGHHARS